jgi:hypothetical protein
MAAALVEGRTESTVRTFGHGFRDLRSTATGLGGMKISRRSPSRR